MKKIILLAVLILSFSPCYAHKENVPEVKLQSIFLTDTSEAEDYIEPENIPLKGYAEYLEDTEAIYLKDDCNQFVLNLKVPQKISTTRLSDEHEKIHAKKPVSYSKYGSEEYLVIPKDVKSTVSTGKGVSLGTKMEQEVDYGELEHTTTMFTKYDKGRFSLTTAYKRTIGSTYNNYYDSVYVAPELKLNKYLSIKEIFTSQMTLNRKKAEFVLSINPLAKKDDRLNLELGASQTYYQTSDLIRNRIRFNTIFKL